MWISTALTVTLLVGWASAAPTGNKSSRTVHKRSSPSIARGFTAQETTQITDGIRDALELAAYVVAMPADTVDPILNKYFNPGDNQRVKDVFNNILGGDPNGNRNDLLSSITISPDFPNAKGDYSCDYDVMGSTRGGNTDNPTMILCDPGALGHGGIGRSYDNVPAVVCDSLDPRTSWKMDTLGSVILHEYTHFWRLVAPPLAAGTDDQDGGYGPIGTRNLDKSMATNNADSFAWMANEVLWTVLCNRQYDNPQSGDDEDPNCDESLCLDDSDDEED